MISVGDRLTLYYKIRTDKETSNFGDSHPVGIYMTKFVTVFQITPGPDTSGYNQPDGDYIYATDSVGRIYTYKYRAPIDYWSARKAFVRDVDAIVFWDHPNEMFARDIWGKPLTTRTPVR